MYAAKQIIQHTDIFHWCNIKQVLPGIIMLDIGYIYIDVEYNNWKHIWIVLGDSLTINDGY